MAVHGNMVAAVDALGSLLMEGSNELSPLISFLMHNYVSHLLWVHARVNDILNVAFAGTFHSCSFGDAAAHWMSIVLAFTPLPVTSRLGCYLGQADVFQIEPVRYSWPGQN